MICQRNFSFCTSKTDSGAGKSIIKLQFEVHPKAVPTVTFFAPSPACQSLHKWTYKLMAEDQNPQLPLAPKSDNANTPSSTKVESHTDLDDFGAARRVLIGDQSVEELARFASVLGIDDGAFGLSTGLKRCRRKTANWNCSKLARRL